MGSNTTKQLGLQTEHPGYSSRHRHVPGRCALEGAAVTWVVAGGDHNVAGKSLVPNEAKLSLLTPDLLLEKGLSQGNESRSLEIMVGIVFYER